MALSYYWKSFRFSQIKWIFKVAFNMGMWLLVPLMGSRSVIWYRRFYRLKIIALHFLKSIVIAFAKYNNCTPELSALNQSLRPAPHCQRILPLIPIPHHPHPHLSNNFGQTEHPAMAQWWWFWRRSDNEIGRHVAIGGSCRDDDGSARTTWCWYSGDSARPRLCDQDDGWMMASWHSGYYWNQIG